MLEKAQLFAKQAHEGQFYGKEDYYLHLESTWKISVDYDLRTPIQAACWLHDTLEDTKATYRQLLDEFGFEVAELVYAVTDELGRNRRERKRKTYQKIFEYGKDAALLKLCDRVANIHYSKTQNKKLFLMYHQDHYEFSQLYKQLNLCNNLLYQRYELFFS